MKQKKIVLAGGSGFIGSYMSRYWCEDNEVVVLTRKREKAGNNSYGRSEKMAAVKYVKWDGKTCGEWAKELEGADLLINLAGKSVNCRYSYRNMKEIFTSRLDATRVLAEAVKKAIHPPALWINIASATIYRNALDHAQDEYAGEISELKAMNMPASSGEDIKSFIYKWVGWLIPPLFVDRKAKIKKDFSVRVCREWEACFEQIETARTRKICLRTAVTLGDGGVMVPYMNLVKAGLGGRQGNGRQLYSWIHVEDLCRIAEWLEVNKEVSGTLNAAAPAPVTNTIFMKALRKAMGFWGGLPAYKWMLEIGAVMIGTEPELILKSRWVIPAKLLEQGFHFKYARIEEAFEKIMTDRKHEKRQAAPALHLSASTAREKHPNPATALSIGN
ncbi:MAG: DUF1731 domain-containing protein [Chitinophagaceae bacterium]|nr:DUF1731 domain-containing protein [Chitinophagaceae bacterium]